MIYRSNEFNEEVLNTKDAMKWVAEIIITKDINRLENAIKNTYTKDDANKIINNLNLLLEMVGE